MRSLGLTLCLLASSLGARAETVEERVTALEARVKALEQALQKAAPTAADIAGSYKAALPDGKVMTLELKDGKVVAALGTDTKTGTYEVIGDKVVITVDSKPEPFTVEGDHLKAVKGNEKIDFVKIK
jgi:hypothetical protein